MEQRMNVQEIGKNAFAALYPLGRYLKQSTLDQQLLHLVYYRVSQINRCAFCLDMHAKDLRAAGETEQRLFVLDAWREAPFYSDQERAALAWAEALTTIKSGLVPDETYEEAQKHFSDQELVDLTFGIIAINSYNRINIAFGAPVGTYRVGQFN